MTLDNANHRCGLPVSAVWEKKKPWMRLLHARQRVSREGTSFNSKGEEKGGIRKCVEKTLRGYLAPLVA